MNQLGAQIAANNGSLAGFEHRLVNIELVRVHRALHHCLAQPVAGSDEDHVLKAAFGVDGEHHAGRALVAANHALHAGGQGHVGMRVALMNAVADGAVVVKRGEDLFHLAQHVVDADHV